MLNRRTMLAAMAATGVATTAKVASAATPQRELRVMLYDSRYPQSEAYAKASASASVLLVDTHTRDIGLAWQHEIKAHLAAQPGAIAGVSLYSDQMISQIMGREHGMKRLTSVRVEDAPSLYSWRIV
jgi:hypothetical protein